MLKPRRRKCKHCGDYYLPKFKSTEPCPKYDCRMVELKIKTPKIKKKLLQMAKAENKPTDHRSILQKEVQLIARLIDFKCLCLARNIRPYQPNGGHVFSNQGNTNMSLNLHNIFLQSAMSNGSQQDDGYMQDGVARVFGEDYLSFIRGLKRTPIMKHTNEDYKEIRERAKIVIDNLKLWNEDLVGPRSATSRIQLRNWVNTELGIYPNEFLNF